MNKISNQNPKELAKHLIESGGYCAEDRVSGNCDDCYFQKCRVGDYDADLLKIATDYMNKLDCIDEIKKL